MGYDITWRHLNYVILWYKLLIFRTPVGKS